MTTRLPRAACAVLAGTVLSLTALTGCGAGPVSPDRQSGSSGPAVSAPATSTAATGSGPELPPPTPHGGPTTPATAIGSGITGVTVVDGGCPVQRLDSPCPDRPLQGRLTVTDAAGTVVATAETDPAGHFHIPLPPGHYAIQATNPSGSPLPRAAPTTATVASGRYTTLTIRFDSGIR